MLADSTQHPSLQVCICPHMAGKYSCEEQQLVSVALGAGGDWALVVIN